MPLTWGWRRPSILLPAGFARWEPNRLSIVLAHEMAHVTRADWPVQIAAEIARALYWFHPLVWLAAARLREESERAADDAVLRAGFTGPNYAHHLVEVARTHRHPFGALAAALGMARSSPIERRITALLDGGLHRGALSRRTAAMSLFAMFAAMIPFAALVLAQDTRVIVAQNAAQNPQTPAAPKQPAAPVVARVTSFPYEIRGTVTEPGVDHPVVGAEVVLNTENREIGRPIQRTAVETVLTGAQGDFRFRPEKPGLYVVNTTAKEGYIRGTGNSPTSR
jgi:hypothetical protein